MPKIGPKYYKDSEYQTFYRLPKILNFFIYYSKLMILEMMIDMVARRKLLS